MPTYLLRKAGNAPTDHNAFDVIQTLADGYELRVGGVRKTVGTGMREFWVWSCHGANGEALTRDEAMAAFRVAADRVADQDLAEIRREEEWTANKYALWDAGYRDQIRRGAINCPCGETFDPKLHKQTMAHISHITGRAPGT